MYGGYGQMEAMDMQELFNQFCKYVNLNGKELNMAPI